MSKKKNGAADAEPGEEGDAGNLFSVRMEMVVAGESGEPYKKQVEYNDLDAAQVEMMKHCFAHTVAVVQGKAAKEALKQCTHSTPEHHRMFLQAMVDHPIG